MIPVKFVEADAIWDEALPEYRVREPVEMYLKADVERVVGAMEKSLAESVQSIRELRLLADNLQAALAAKDALIAQWQARGKEMEGR